MNRTLDYIYIFATVIFTVYGQLIIKWRVSQFGLLPEDSLGKFKFVLNLLSDPAVVSGFIAAFLASIAWMVAMTKFDLSYAYPFMSLNFVIVLLISNQLFGEPFSTPKIIGVSLIVVGTIISARG